MGERVPQHIQNIVIKDFCQKKKLNFLLSFTEYAIPNSFHILNQLSDNVKGLYGVVIYSLFQLPRDKDKRFKIVQKFIKKKKILFFACESLEISNIQEYKRVEKILLAEEIYANCSKEINYKEYLC